MKSARSKATDISPKVREIIKERDKTCILCGSSQMLTIADYVPRSKGGLGIPENLVLLCMKCHEEFDHSKYSNISDIHSIKIFKYLSNLYPHFEHCNRFYKRNNK
jgi:5-methylcytosine-specific restriction endonuclease McrA